MRILIYTPTNSRAVDLQSVMELFCQMGHEVHLLSQLPEGALHKNVQQFGVRTHSYKIGVTGFAGYFKHARHLAWFIRQHKIDCVFAHLQAAGLAAGIARKWVKFTYYYVRHNTDEHKLQKSRNASIINFLTNKLAKKIIAPSEKVYNYLVSEEKISKSRLVRINYGYNFSQYLQSDRQGDAAAIRSQFPCRMLVISVARLIPVKRHQVMFDVIRRLKEEGADIKMICLSDGPSKESLDQYIREQSLQDCVFLLGAKPNVFDYLEAADVFFHLSETEASNSAVKEAGYCRRTSIVCNDVGDFDDYIQDGVNGFIASKKDPAEQSVAALTKLYNEPGELTRMGDNLHRTIITEFSIENVAPLYKSILEGNN